MTSKKDVKIGAPSKYKESFIGDLIEFFGVESFTLDDSNKPIPSKFPTLARFALNCDVHTDTLYEWANGKDDQGNIKKPAFSVAYKKAKLYQEAYLYESGLAGTIDKTFGIWATKTLLGHREPDKIIEVRQEKLEPIPVNIVDAS